MEPYSRLEYEKYIVSPGFNASDDIRDLFGIGKRVIDRFPQFSHQALESLIHACILAVV